MPTPGPNGPTDRHSSNTSTTTREKERIMVKAIEVEIDDRHNHSFWFRPIQRLVRGSYDYNRHSEPQAKVEASKWPGPIPGQRLGIEPDGTGFIREPLHDDEHEPVREMILKKGVTLEPKVQTFDAIDLPSWLFYITRAVEAGIAKVVKGELPAKIDGKVKHNYVFNEEVAESPTDKLTAAIEGQTAVMTKLLERLADK